MPRWRSIWLVARREILERGRSRGFILSVAVHDAHRRRLVRRPGDPVRRRRGRPRSGSSSRRRPASGRPSRRPPTQFDHEVAIDDLPGRGGGRGRARRRAASTSSSTCPADLSGPGEIRFDEEPDQAHRPGHRRPRRSALRVQAVLGDSDVDQAALAAAQQPPAVEALEPQTEADQAAFLFANIGAVLILVGIFSFGFTVLTGVVEEKQSRVVEVVLSTVRPRDLLMGKVLGIGVLGLVQLVVFVVAALIAALVDRPLRRCPPRRPARSPLLVLWFILGYALYSTALGFLGALASRMEEASNASTPGHDRSRWSATSWRSSRSSTTRRDGRHDRHVPAAVGAVRRPAAGRVRRDRAVADRPVGRSSRWPAIWVLFSIGGAGLRRRRAPDRRADEAARRVAVGRGVTPRAVGLGAPASASGSNRPGVPPACQNTTRWPSSAPSRTAATRPARALAV